MCSSYLKFIVVRQFTLIFGFNLQLSLFLQPPNCSPPSTNRLRRQATSPSGTSSGGAVGEGTPATIEVYSGLYVNEANDLAKAGLDGDSVYSEKVSFRKKNRSVKSER